MQEKQTRKRAMFAHCIALTLPTILLFGCGIDRNSPYEVRGTVSLEDDVVEKGEIRFLPIEGTPGPVCWGAILDGRYDIEARGGVPLGKYRVEIDAYRKTGRKVSGKPPAYEIMVDEYEPVGAAMYRGDSSPLRADEDAIRSGNIDFNIPRG